MCDECIPMSNKLVGLTLFDPAQFTADLSNNENIFNIFDFGFETRAQQNIETKNF